MHELREGSGTRAGLYRPPGRSKFGSTSCATLSPCPGCSGSVGTAGTGRVLLVCVPVGEPGSQGRWGPRRTFLRDPLQPVRICSVTAAAQIRSDPSHVEACKRLCRSGIVPVHPSVSSVGSAGFVGLASSIKPNAEEINPSLLLADYNSFSSFHYLQQRNNSGNQVSSTLSGWIWLDYCLFTVCVFPVPFQLVVGHWGGCDCLPKLSLMQQLNPAPAWSR